MTRVEQTFHAAADGSIVALVQGPTPGAVVGVDREIRVVIELTADVRVVLRSDW
jgi:hypothetical protein